MNRKFVLRVYIRTGSLIKHTLVNECYSPLSDEGSGRGTRPPTSTVGILIGLNVVVLPVVTSVVIKRIAKGYNSMIDTLKDRTRVAMQCDSPSSSTTGGTMH